jgi:hypothetical protein
MALTRKSDGPDPRRNPKVRPFRILSLDPGGTTGWASSQFPNGRELRSLDDLYFNGGQIGPEEHHHELWEHLKVHHSYAKQEGVPFEVVCESFEFRQHINKEHAKTKVELISKEYIGIVKLFCVTYEIPLTFYTASAAKAFVPDKGPQRDVRIKALGIDRRRPEWEHYMDAARHLLRHMVIGKRIREPITDKWV